VAGPVRRLIKAHARREVGAGADEFQLATRPDSRPCLLSRAEGRRPGRFFGLLVPIRRLGWPALGMSGCWSKLAAPNPVGCSCSMGAAGGSGRSGA